MSEVIMAEERKKIQLTACELTFMDNQIVHARFNAGREVDTDDIDEMFAAMHDACKGVRNLFLVSVDTGTTLSNAAREVVSSKDATKYIVADAIVVRDFQHQLSANAFIRHNKPERPVKTFETQEKAVAWLDAQRHLLDNQD